jgi:hypothetical protein
MISNRFNRAFIFFAILAIAVIFLPAALPEQVRSETLEDFRHELDEVRLNIRELEGREEQLRSRLSELSEQVKIEKRKATRWSDLMGNLRLRDLLNQSKILADRLDSTVKQRNALETREKEIIERLIELFYHEINRLQPLCLKDKDKEACRRLSAFQKELYELLSIRLKDKKVKVIDVGLLPTDGPEEIKVKLEVLRHQLRQVDNLIGLYRKNIPELSTHKKRYC